MADKIKATVSGSTLSERVRKRGADATTITLSISKEDKVLVKTLAAKEGLAVSDLLHLWIKEKCKE